MKDYIYVIRPVKPDFLNTKTTEDNQIIEEHWNYLLRSKNEGIVKFVGRTANAEFGICVYSSDNDETADEFMNSDPAIKKGVFIAEYYPFNVAIS